MSKFIKSSLFFLALFISILCFGLLLPNNSPVRSIDYSLIKKHELLANTKENKIVLTGGSNVIFGFNSKTISDSLNIPVINHSIHAGYGMKYILDDVERFINKGDILIFSPEYSHFLEKNYLGKEPLLFSLTAIPKNLGLVSIGQLINIAPFIPQFSFQRVKSFLYYTLKKENKGDIKKTYGEFAINTNGDNNTHWLKNKQNFKPYVFKGSHNNEPINYLIDFKNRIQKKGAKLIVLAPSLCNTSYLMNNNTIKQIHEKLTNNNIPVVGNPEDFVYDDRFFFDSPYHLNGKGVKKRTKQLIQILKK